MMSKLNIKTREREIMDCPRCGIAVEVDRNGKFQCPVCESWFRWCEDCGALFYGHEVKQTSWGWQCGECEAVFLAGGCRNGLCPGCAAA